MDQSREHLHAPGPSLWPVGFAVGVVVLLVGLVVSTTVVAIGAVIAVVFTVLWVRDIARGRGLVETTVLEPEMRPAPKATPHLSDVRLEDRYPRNVFLELSTLGLGGVVGGVVTLPALGFMIAPAFLKQGVKEQDVGPVSDYPLNKYMVATFDSDPSQGTVARRAAFVRNNGMLGSQPSFTIISSRCAHLGCPVQPNGPKFGSEKKVGDITLQGYLPSGFGCPCHGGQYDTEGNRTAGPPVRALDRYSFSVRNNHLWIGAPFSVSHVDGTGAEALIHKWTYSYPGQHVDGIESWLYPIEPPR